MAKTASEHDHSKDESAHKESQLAFLFDLDGTLVDTMYFHVLAWQEAFKQVGMEVPGWRIQRRIGMSGAMLVRALMRASGRTVTEKEVETLEHRHGEAYARHANEAAVLPGARELLSELSRLEIAWAIVTSSRPEKAQPLLKKLEIGSKDTVVTRGDVQRAKPEPDPFLVGAERLGVSIRDCAVVGDSVWDLLSAQRARALGIGFLTGGYGREELERAGAYRVYDDAANLLDHLDELGIRRE